MDNETIIAIAAVSGIILGATSLLYNIYHSRSAAHRSERLIKEWERSVKEWKSSTTDWKETVEELKKVVISHNGLVQAFEKDIRAIKGEMSIIRDQVQEMEMKIGQTQQLAEVTERSRSIDRELEAQKLAQQQREHEWNVIAGIAKGVAWLSQQPDYDEDEEY